MTTVAGIKRKKLLRPVHIISKIPLAAKIRSISLVLACSLLLQIVLQACESPTARGVSTLPPYQAPTVIVTPVVSPPSLPTLTTQPLSVPTSIPIFSSSQLVERPLAELSADAQRFLEGREGRWGVAVVVPGQKTIYTANGDQLMSMASVAKVAVMITVMDRAIKGNRRVTDRELQLMHPMITTSDNDATTSLWNDLGGGTTVEAYLRSIGITDIVPNSADAWGASRASAKAVAMLFAKLAFGEILDQTNRELALELLAGIIPSQQWGITAGIPEERPPGTIIGLKDGWYPAGYGWWVNSAGMLIPGDEHPAYTIAVLTRGQPSWEYGIATIEGVAERVHATLHGGWL